MPFSKKQIKTQGLKIFESQTFPTKVIAEDTSLTTLTEKDCGKHISIINPANDSNINLPSAKVGRRFEFIVRPSVQEEGTPPYATPTPIAHTITFNCKEGTSDVFIGVLPTMSLFASNAINTLLNITSSTTMALLTNFTCYTFGYWTVSGLGLNNYNDD